MLRTRTSWLVSLPLLLGGTLLGHALAYDLAGPIGHDHGGHGYLELAPALLAPLGAVALAALVLRVRRPRSRALPQRTLALLPPLVFVLQEHLEHLHDVGAVALDLTFLVGLLLQLPLALVAVLLARTLLVCADGLGESLVRRPCAIGTPGRESPPVGAEPAKPRALAFGAAGRAPPLPA